MLTYLSDAAYMTALERFAGLSHRVVIKRVDGFTTRTRREFRGDRRRIEFDTSQASSWLQPFLIYRANNTDVCNAVADKYEARLNRFGYSLRELLRVEMTETVRPFALQVDAEAQQPGS